MPRATPSGQSAIIDCIAVPMRTSHNCGMRIAFALVAVVLSSCALAQGQADSPEGSKTPSTASRDPNWTTNLINGVRVWSPKSPAQPVPPPPVPRVETRTVVIEREVLVQDEAPVYFVPYPVRGPIRHREPPHVPRQMHPSRRF
jgi:hypothetical protein